MNDDMLVGQAAAGDAQAFAELQRRVCARRGAGPPITWPDDPTPEQLMVLFYLWDDRAMAILRDRFQGELLGSAHVQLRGRVSDACEAAQDMVQLVWLDVSRTRSLCRNRWTAPSPVGPWLHGIRRNRCAGYARAQHQMSGLPDAELPAPGSVPTVHAQRLEDRVGPALDRMEQGARDLLIRHYWEDQDVKVIAADLGLNTGRVYTLLARARAQFESYLDH